MVAMDASGSAHHLACEIGQLGPSGPVDSIGLREVVRQAAEERCRGCRGDLRGCPAPDHAFRSAQE